MKAKIKTVSLHHEGAIEYLHHDGTVERFELNSEVGPYAPIELRLAVTLRDLFLRVAALEAK